MNVEPALGLARLHRARLSGVRPISPHPLRAPFGWPLVPLSPAGGIVLRWAPDAAARAQGGWLRITTGVDDREPRRIRASLADEGRALGEFDLRFAHALEPFALWLSPEDASQALRQGVRLELAEPGSRPLWLLGGDALPDPRLAPHWLPAEQSEPPVAAFWPRLASLASVQPFGWMEGCILDALHDLHADTAQPCWREARDAHLALFFRPEGLIYEDPSGRPADDTVRCIEETLPFAVLAKAHPGHPFLSIALEYWRANTRDDLSVEDDDRLVSAEGSYTIAYPMAVIAALRQDRTLAEKAARQLRIRRDLLRRADGLWLRYWRQRDERHFRSWARGVAWYLLGLIRTLEQLRGWTDVADLEAEARQAAAWATAWQRADGLWGCFIDDPASAPDTSGSAGIGAALARGARLGLLPPAAMFAAERAWTALQTRLLPDGLLGGAAQSNRGGEALQRSDYRVLSPVGTGLMGQLGAALRKGRRIEA